MSETTSTSQQETDNQHVNILIVGAGLVGASCAALLAKMTSASIAVIDPGQAPAIPNVDQESPEFDPRVVAVSYTHLTLPTTPYV